MRHVSPGDASLPPPQEADSAFDEVKRHDAILLGAIGDPRIEVGLLEFGIIAKLRFELDLYVNLRPIKLYAEHLCPLKDKKPEDVDFVVVRENAEDAYAGMRGSFEEVGREYPDIARDHAYIDAATMWCVKNPEWFDTVVTSNMFGDILTDLAAMIQGGLGIAASGNIHPGRVSLFESIHGSAPKYAGKNVASPIATIMAVQMLLDYLGETRAAARIEETVAGLIRVRKIPSLGSDSGLSTSPLGDMVAEALERAKVPA